MIDIFTGIVLVILIAALWLYLCAPSKERKRCEKWRGVKFAHRGLYGNGIAENSLSAFDAACKAGYGMELDVQFTKDKRLVVFHDDDLFRMTGDKRYVRDLTLSQLKKLRLNVGGERIPTFDEVLRTVNGRAPLLVEIKNAKDINALTKATIERLETYKGEYLVESFNPLSLLWMRKHAKHIIRGQLVSGASDFHGTLGLVKAILLSGLFMNVASRPDFIAYSISMPEFSSLTLQRRVFKTPLAAWTLTDADEVSRLSDMGEMPIFEHIDIV